MISTVFYQLTVLLKYHILINHPLFPDQLPTLDGRFPSIKRCLSFTGGMQVEDTLFLAAQIQ